MHILIPALIKSAESEDLLRLTLKHIPAAAKATVVVISQGTRPRLTKTANLKQLIWRHYAKPIAKWSAIVQARRAAPIDDDQIVLLDADDPVEISSFPRVISQCKAEPDVSWFGRRSEISLRAKDEQSTNSRMFFELFSNTLLLASSPIPESVLADPPDIQSGLYIIPTRFFTQATFDYVLDYGGELALFHQLAQLKAPIANVDYVPQPRETSSYHIRQIVTQVMGLPFFNCVLDQQIDKAKALAPIVYQRYVSPRLLAPFEREISHLLAGWRQQDD